MYGVSGRSAGPAQYNYNNMVDDMSNMHLASQTQIPPAYQQMESSKVAPTVPPKPRKPHEYSPGNVYSNSVPAMMPSGKDFYAVNAPAPGSVGVASARVSRAANNECDYLTPGKTGRSDSRLYNPESTPPSHYTPPPPQPARSYTPISKMAVHMGAAQPLYSNTASKQQQHHQPVYSNQQQTLYSNVGAAPAPPPPAPSAHSQQLYANVAPRNGGGSAYASYGADSDFPLPPPEVLPPSDYPPHPPASPVSSAYSELRRANPQPRATAAAVHAGGTYAGTANESLYEPISPRPPSQMSTRSAGYGPVYGNSTQAPGYAAHPAARNGPAPPNKEAEVDALTSMLVQSMESSGDPEFFGICARCGGKVVGEGTGCTAMDQVFHIRCFDCIVCHQQLQGKPFYAVDNKPYCEDCYLNTLEKCCVCDKPILDRILRATGKPYHPACFTCVVCFKALDGIPFTVDAANQIHCIDCFHKKFAPRCSVCKEPIMPEPGLEETVRVVALDRSFHVNCYKCEDCGLLLSSEAEGRGCYPLDGHVLCKSCNAARVQALSSQLAVH